MNARFSWWNNLRHGGLLLDTQRLTELVPEDPPGLSSYDLDRLRRRLTQFQDDNEQHRGKLVSFVLETICGFARPLGEWYRGSEVSTKWSRRAITGESVRPRHLWIGKNAAALPVFVDDEPRVGAGRGRRTISHVLQWLRQGSEQLALVTNGQEWRLLFAGLDYEAFCQWDADAWFAEGDASPELNGFRALMHPTLWTPAKKDEPCRLLAAVNDSRKGQADLSQVLGERVRQAAELLIQAHTPVLKDQIDGPASQDIYRAAVRMIMRLVVVLFAESREGLLARDNPVFHTAYSLQGLREQLQRINQHKLVGSAGAWFRVLALLRLIHQGSSHPDLPVPAYGGELFAPGRSEDADGMKRALHLFETACFGADVMTDYQVRQILDLLTRTKVKIRQGKASMLISAPVDFSSLGSEYIGILYEGLLDFELRCAVENEPIVFLAVGNQPALPLSTLERMDDRAIKNLLEKLKDTSSSADDDEEASGEQGDDADEEVEKPAAVDEEPGEEVEEEVGEEEAVEEVPSDDPRFTLKTRAEAWARRVCEIGKLVAKPRGKLTPERRMQFEKALDGKARQLVVKVVLPGEWYLVRWGGTRKGSGTFYTRPQLAIPTVHRTLRPLAYNPPTGDDGQPDQDAPASKWTPKKPDEILSLKVCDPACGSGSFPLAALRFLTEALYESLRAHGRIRDHGGRAVLDLIYDEETHETLASEPLPCRPDDDDFETRTKAILRRYVVERCIYGVDIDPLAVELCRLSLWIETLDRSLPLTFLNHKIKCGNSLVGAWFDQFLHYPAMAWQREGGDKNHSNGVHFKKEAWTKAIKEFAKKVKSDLIEFIDGGRFQSMFSVDLATVQTGHDAAEAALKKIHSFGIAQVDQRAACYDALLASPEFQNLKAAFDLWCSLWFWPADGLDHAPLPTQFAAGQIDAQGREIVGQVARRHRFFHWELEFPDVFNAQSHGFDAVLGNPPWEISKPNSKEFFSTFDPLYRGYGKQEAVRRQTELFEQDSGLEHRWLDYCAALKAMSNWVKFAGFPFGDRVTVNSQGKESHDLNLGDRGASSFATSHRRHQRWKAKREESAGYADAEHSFRHQGSADINLYKLFLEQAHALLTENGRLGLIVPSGLYSDFGTGDLRRLFVDRCRWEWLFGFENREGIFDIHRSFKFNPVIIAKGGQTQAIRTAFMRRGLADWEKGEQFVTHYTREQVVQFSPNSRAILEIQSQRDLEVLTKIYANSVLLGDQSENGWGIQYAREFDMTNDSKLFPPRPKWEEWGYRPDEYSRWIKGPWKPVEKLWAELGVDPAHPMPIDPECERRIRDGIARGEVACTTPQPPTTGDQAPIAGHLRCAQPPYNKLPIPRADIPAGVILSREATHFIREDQIPEVTFTDASGKPLRLKSGRSRDTLEICPAGTAVAYPVFEGRMVGQLDFSEKGWVSGSGRSAVWREIPWLAKQVEPQYLMGASTYEWSLVLPYLEDAKKHCGPDDYHAERERMEDSVLRQLWTQNRARRITFMDVTSATNERTMVSALATPFPYGNSAPVFSVHRHLDLLSLVLNSFVFDTIARARCSGLHLNWFVVEEAALPNVRSIDIRLFERLAPRLTSASQLFAPHWEMNSASWRSQWAVTASERLRIRCQLEAIIARAYEITTEEYNFLLAFCDYPPTIAKDKSITSMWPPKGFWRIDRAKSPEHRFVVLSQIAYCDLCQAISALDDVTKGIKAFCSQNHGEGWMLPETVRLADYGLGHDDRAKEHQPVRKCFGPRFYDWQLAQTPEESWRECHLHARNLLGPEGYKALLAELAGEAPPRKADGKSGGKEHQHTLFPTEHLPLFPDQAD